MALKTITVLEDDLDGSIADRTVVFSFSDQQYEIDLNARHADEMREALRPYLDAARELKRQREPKVPKTAKASGPSAKLVRAWAAENGVAVNPVGRVPRSVVESYLESN